MRTTSIIFLFISLSCQTFSQEQNILTGAEQLEEYLPIITDKKIGLTVNHSSLIGDTHLVDTLLALRKDQLRVFRIFTPEHGFAGKISDGVAIQYEDSTSGLDMVSLYGENKKPTGDQMQNLDLMLFDVQDVGARFYTYISTLHYVMEACAENDVPLIVLDRPNPNGSYVDGPVLDTAYRSFVGMHPIPIVYGLTMGELAQMINGERWLKNGVQCDLSVIKLKNWNHNTMYELPVKPSPNLPNSLSIALYPSLCLFEGTIMSVGRGTPHPFQQIGHPDYPDKSHSFTPSSVEGARWPPYEDVLCYGVSWVDKKPNYKFSLQPILDAFSAMDTSTFFNNYFKRLVGNEELQKQIEDGLSKEQIRKSWEPALNEYRRKRLKYLLYD